MKGISLLPNLAGDHKFLNEDKDLLIGKFVVWVIGDIVEVAEVGMNDFHQDDRVKRNINFEGLWVLIPKFDKSV